MLKRKLALKIKIFRWRQNIIAFVLFRTDRNRNTLSITLIFSEVNEILHLFHGFFDAKAVLVAEIRMVMSGEAV